MVYVCCVPLCQSKSSDNNVSFHAFASDEKRQKIWIQKIKRDTQKNIRNQRPFRINKHVKICSKHFTTQDFKILSPTRRMLKKTAVPTHFPWTSEAKRKITRRSDNTNVEEVCLVKTCVEPPSVCLRGMPVNSAEEAIARVECQTVRMDEVSKKLLVCSITSEDQVSGCNGDIAGNPKPSTSSCEKEIVISPQEQTSKPTAIQACSTDYCRMYVDVVIEHEQLKERMMELEKKLLEQQKKHIMEVAYFNTEPLFSIQKFKQDPHQMAYYTGFPNYDIFKISLDLLFGSSKNRPIPMHGRTSEKHYNKKLATEDQYFLTLIKLRQDFGYEHLSVLFNVSVSTVGNIFISWINFIYLRLGSLDIWPHRAVITKNAPPDYVTRYQNVFGSIDATEFLIQTPSSLVRQSQTYSQYKSHNTVKGMVVTDPNGAIMFISALFTGSISDNQLVQDSCFIDMLKSKLESGFLEPGDIFLADKGFRIQELLNHLQLNINIPVFRITGCQFSEDEVEVNRTVAHERVHVERAIGRIKSFKILTHEVPITLLGSFNQIWTVCALLTNFRMPLRAKKHTEL